MDPIPVSCEIDEGDFVGDDGLLRCGKCGAGKQVRVDWGGQTTIMPVMCRCQVEEADRLDAARRAAARVRSVEGSPSHKLCLPLDPGHEFGLGRDDRRGFRIVREYARHWEQMAEGGHGLVLIGPPGTGKTFAAGCLANFLIHDGKVPLVTSVSRAENVLWDAKGDERTRMLEGIRSTTWWSSTTWAPSGTRPTWTPGPSTWLTRATAAAGRWWSPPTCLSRS